MRECVICGGTNETRNLRSGKYKGQILCTKHRTQVYRYGDILKRTRFDSNGFVEYDDCYEIICYGIKGQETGRGLIDKEDIELIKKYKWRMGDNGRIITDIEKKVVKLHLLLMNRIEVEDGNVVDHINRNPSDNRRCNLRIASLGGNSTNRSLSKSANTSGYIGVTYQKRDKCWRAYIKKDKKITSRSGFKNIEDALRLRLIWEFEIFGSDFAPQRHLFKEYGIGEDANV